MIDTTITKSRNDTEEEGDDTSDTTVHPHLRQEKGISDVLLFFVLNLPDLCGDTRSRMEGGCTRSSMVRHPLLVR